MTINVFLVSPDNVFLVKDFNRLNIVLLGANSSAQVTDMSSVSGDIEWFSKKASSFFTDLPIPESSFSSESNEATLLPETVVPKIVLPPQILWTVPDSDLAKILRRRSVFLLRNNAPSAAEANFRERKSKNRSKSFEDVAIRVVNPLVKKTLSGPEISLVRPVSDNESYATATSGSSHWLAQDERDSSSTDIDVYMTPKETHSYEENAQLTESSRPSWVHFN